MPVKTADLDQEGAEAGESTDQSGLSTESAE